MISKCKSEHLPGILKLLAMVVSMSCHLLPHLIRTDVFQESQHVVVWLGPRTLGGLIWHWKQLVGGGKRKNQAGWYARQWAGLKRARQPFLKWRAFLFFVQTVQIKVFVPRWQQTRAGRGGSERLLVGAIVWLLVKVTPHQFCAYFWHSLGMLNSQMFHSLRRRNLSVLVGWSCWCSFARLLPPLPFPFSLAALSLKTIVVGVVGFQVIKHTHHTHFYWNNSSCGYEAAIGCI